MATDGFSYASAQDPLWRRVALGGLERLAGARAIERLYRAQQAQGWPEGFFWSALRALEIDVTWDAAQLARIPSDGPLVVVANHPFGVLDGIVMCALMERARPDFLVLTNAVLMRAPEMRDRVLPVDFAETRAARRTNLESRAAACAHVGNGGCCVIFPAGAVSTSPDRFGRRPAVDGPWSPFAAKLVLQGGAAVLPAFFPGQNSRLFQIASHIHPWLRLGLFLHEVRRQIGGRIHVELGATLPAERFATLDRAQTLAVLREAVYAIQTAQPRPR